MPHGPDSGAGNSLRRVPQPAARAADRCHVDEGATGGTVRARRVMIEAHQRLEAWKSVHNYYAVMYSRTGTEVGPTGLRSPWTAEEVTELHGLQRGYLNAVRDYERSLRR
jgi:hypothetical protein